MKGLQDVTFGRNRRDGVKVTIRFLSWETWIYFATVLRKTTYEETSKIARDLRRHGP